MANYVKFRRGNPTAFQAILDAGKAERDTLYFIYEEDESTSELYLGSKLIAGGGEVIGATTLTALQDVLLNSNLNENDCLIYDISKKKWVNKPIADILPIFVGTNGESSAVAGLVPAPKENNPNLFLRSDGEWTEIITTSESLVLQTIVGSNESHEAAIARIISSYKLNKGDIVILQELIADDHYQYISYVYNGTSWAAMDGNYNAENVYFNDDILVTTEIGTIQTLVNGQATLQAKGKNVKQVLSSLLAERKNPIATKPSASIELTNSTLTYEVGEKVIPTWQTTFTSGSYTYGPATGVTDAGGVISSTKDENVLSIAAGRLNNMSGSFNEYQVEDDTKYYAKLTYGWSAGTTTPVDNFGDEYVNAVNNLPIQAASGKTNTSDKYISGYRKWFKGGLNTSSADVNLTSEIIRDNLIGSTAAVTSHTFDIEAVNFDSCKRIVIAIPSAANKVITKVYLKSTSNIDITSLFEELEETIDVAGANDYIAKPYRVWVYEPASLDSTEVYTITLG